MIGIVGFRELLFIVGYLRVYKTKTTFFLAVCKFFYLYRILCHNGLTYYSTWVSKPLSWL